MFHFNKIGTGANVATDFTPTAESSQVKSFPPTLCLSALLSASWSLLLMEQRGDEAHWLFTRPCRWESLWMEPELACRLHVIYRLLFGNTHRKKSSLLQTFSVLSLMRWGKPGQISSYTRVSHHPFISQSEVTQLNVRKIITAGADGNVVTGTM